METVRNESLHLQLQHLLSITVGGGRLNSQVLLAPSAAAQERARAAFGAPPSLKLMAQKFSVRADHRIMEALQLEKPPRTSDPTTKPAQPGPPLDHVPKSHIYTFFKHF